MLPTQKLETKSSKSMPPGPSSPASMPKPMKIKSSGRPAFAVTTPTTRLAKTSKENASRGRLRKSREKGTL
jgi:hypothetical protein